MESGAISGWQITASSEYDACHAADHSRLNYRGESAAWSALVNDANQWLQIDLNSYFMTVTRIATQGRDDQYDQWVTKYKLQYSNDEVTFKHYREQGQNAHKVRYILWEGTWVNYFWVCAAGLSEPLPHYRLFCG